MLSASKLSLTKSLFVLLLTFLCLGCLEEEGLIDQEAPEYAMVDDEFIPFITEFVTEAIARGVVLDLDSIEMRLVSSFSTVPDEVTSDPCGAVWLNYQGTGIIRIEIINSSDCWFGQSDIEKENFLFHQFGHAALKRRDLRNQFENGKPASIMCSSFCDNHRVYFDIPEMRTYYLDELFDETTPFPAWVNNDNFVSNVFSGEDFDESLVGWQYGRVSDIDNVSGYEFKLAPPGIFPTTSLHMNVANQPPANVAFDLGRTFDIPDFEGCMTLKVTADINTRTIMPMAHIRLYVNSGNGNDGPFNSGFLDGHVNNYWSLTSDTNHKLEAILYCIPPEARGGSVFIRIFPDAQSDVYVDNIQVDFYN